VTSWDYEREPRHPVLREWLSLLLLAAAVPVLFFGLDFLLLKLAQVFA
jgi:hypothetical protein